MRNKIIALLGLLSLAVNVHAVSANHHYNTSPENDAKAQQSKQDLQSNAKWAGACEIEVINNSYNDIWVSGVFDDGSGLGAFVIPGCGFFMCDSPHYINLYYYGYCHAGMNLYMDTNYGYTVYAGYTASGSTVNIR